MATTLTRTPGRRGAIAAANSSAEFSDASAEVFADRTEGGSRPTTRPRWASRYARFLVLSDALVAALAAGAALLLRFGGAGGTYAWVTVAFPALWVLSLALCRCYESRFLAEGTEEFRRVVETAVRVVAGLALFAWAFDVPFSRGYAGLALLATVIGSLTVRALARLHLVRLRRVGRASHRVLVVGGARSAVEVARGLVGTPGRGFKVVGLLTDDGMAAADPAVAPVVGRLSDVHEALAAHRIDTLLVVPSAGFEPRDLRRLSWELED
ncbi:MAG TPA: hypothetical protein VMI11_11700, partial [Actinomycetes bacterium]|nr:hypothetical protein [Actinomycetes bacterium]